MSSSAATRPVTVLLQAAKHGEREALDELMRVVYAELHRMAAAHMRRERQGHTLGATALVAEAYVRLAGSEAPDFESRAHFFAVASQQMRRVLVDHARKRSAEKRGGGGRAVTLDDAVAADDRPEEMLLLDDALEALAALDERKVKVVELSYFGGLSQAEVAAALGVHENTVARDLRMARAFIERHMRAAAEQA